MSGRKGRSGAPGVPKSTGHREAIATGLKAFWDSPEGREVRERNKEAARVRRLRLRSEREQEVRRERS